MRALLLKSNYIFVFMMACSIIGTLSGCGRTASQQLQNGHDKHLFSIGEKMGTELTENYPEREEVLSPANICLKHESWEEAVSYFMARFPGMYSLEAYLYGENTLWNFEKKMLDQVFYKIKEPEGSHGFFLQNGEVYEIFSRETPDSYNMVDTTRNNMGYDYDSCFLWAREEGGNTMYEDCLAGKYCYIRNLENEEVVRFQAEIIEKVSDDFFDINTYKVEIFDENEDELLQEIQVDSTYAHKSPFEFEDFNADGYQDITVLYYYGANGGSASHYIFSPSKQEFVELDSELSYYGMYSVELDTRRLYMHYHGSAIDGTEITYQWKNEMDYEIIKQYDHERVDDNVHVKIIRYDNGKEEILSDYLYPFDECMERDDIWGTYYEDFIWEKEVTDRTTGKKYMIRYAEVYLPEEAERYQGIIYYDGRIYVYDEDTYLVSVRHTDFIDQSDSIEWENGDGDKEPAVVIHYVDGGRSSYYLSELIQPDYQSAS